MIKINNLTKKYFVKDVLKGIDLIIPSGQVIGLLGVNGAGKSTLLKACCRLIKPSGGDVIYDDVVQESFYDDVVFMSEEGTFFDDLSVMDNAAMLNSLMNNFDMKRFVKLATYFNLTGSNTHAGKLSRGEKSKLELALGFCKGGKYIFIDEPFLGADIFSRRDFLKLMIAELGEDKTIVITTHQVEELQNLLDRAVIIVGGKIAVDIDVAELEERGGDLIEEFIKAHSHIKGIDKQLKL